MIMITITIMIIIMIIIMIMIMILIMIMIMIMIMIFVWGFTKYSILHNFHRAFGQRFKLILNFPIFRENGFSLELFNIIFEKSIPKGFFSGKMKKRFRFFDLAPNSLQVTDNGSLTVAAHLSVNCNLTVCP